MKKSRFPEEQIVFALKQAELGTSVPDITFCGCGGTQIDGVAENGTKQ